MKSSIFLKYLKFIIGYLASCVNWAEYGETQPAILQENQYIITNQDEIPSHLLTVFEKARVIFFFVFKYFRYFIFHYFVNHRVPPVFASKSICFQYHDVDDLTSLNPSYSV